MASSGTLPRARADEAFVAMLIAHDAVEADVVDDVRAALADEPNGMGLTEALIDAGVLPAETAALFVQDLEQGVCTCPGCGGRFNVARLEAGSRFRCKTCGAAVTVPTARITREVLGRFAWDAGDVDVAQQVAIDGAPVAAADALSDDEMDAVLSGGTEPGQLIDFSAMAAEEAPAPRAPKAPRSSRPRSERPARRSSRRDAAVDDADGDDDDEAGDLEGEKDAYFWQRLMIFVVGPIILCAVGIYFTPAIKRAMMGRPVDDPGEFQVYEDSGHRKARSGGPTIGPRDCDDWKAALAAVREAMALADQARVTLASGNTAKAIEQFDAADAKFIEAYEHFDEVQVLYGEAAAALDGDVKQWTAAQEQAAADRAQAAGG